MATAGLIKMDNKVVTAAQVSGGGFLVFISKLDLASWSYIAGISVAVLGLAGSFYWQWRKDKRDALVNAAILNSIREKGVVLNDQHLD